jgi:drug/metabolite transporter (DMT)-like permease
MAGENIDGVTAAYQRILGGLAVAAVALLLVKHKGVIQAATAGHPAGLVASRAARWRQAWPWLLANGLAGPALGVSCFQWALKTTPTGVVLPIVAITPIVIIPFARLVEDERPTGRSLVGGLLAVIGAVALSLA